MKPSSSPSDETQPAAPAGAGSAAGSRARPSDESATPDRGSQGVLLGPLFGPSEPRHSHLSDEWTLPPVDVSDLALLRAMLDVESALARAGADAGVVPSPAADAIAAVCEPNRYDVGRLGQEAVASGNPVVPLVRAMGAQLPPEAQPWLHHGATSQDILDTALVLVTKRTAGQFPLDTAAATCADLVRAHRRTLMPARTLGQQAGPTTFGLKAAGWLVGLDQSRARLNGVLAEVPVQLGGATGTLAVFGDSGPAVLERLAIRLGLAAPRLPWHTNRQPLLDVAAALGAVVAAAGKIALDVTLLAQTEVGEVSEGSPGGSSALPHKQNPVDSVLIAAAARRVPGVVATLYAAGVHEHERATGAWHAEWEPLLELVRLTGSAVDKTRRLLAGLQIHPERMRANLDLTHGAIMAESVTSRLAPHLGRAAAHDLVARLAAEPGTAFRERLIANPDVRMTVQDIDAALDPANWLGSSEALIDRALAAHERIEGSGARASGEQVGSGSVGDDDAHG